MELDILDVGKGNYVFSHDKLGDVAKVNETAEEWKLKVKYPSILR